MTPTAEHRWRDALFACVLLGVLSLLFWKLRIIDTGQDPRMTLASVDLYISHYPMLRYGFSALRAGDLPLWNPYQFAGQPFLAIPYVGLFYPPNFVFLLFDVPVATEISLLMHMAFGGISMWWLLRHFGVGTIGGLCAALTFMWSGYITHTVNQPPLFAAITWAPLTVLLLDLVCLGRRWAWLGLTLTVTCQILLGTIEIFVHVMYAGGLFTLCRLIERGARHGPVVALTRGLTIVACLLAGALLSAFQLYPSFELTQLSVRAPGSMTIRQALFMGVARPEAFVRSSLENRGIAAVGALPLLGIPLVLGSRKYRVVWIFCTLAAVTTVLLAFGGPLFRLYYASPIGSMFRRPNKFLDMYGFAMAIMGGLAVDRLTGWRQVRVWVQPAYLLALALGAVAIVALVPFEILNPFLIGSVVLVALFGILQRPAARATVIVALCVVQAAHLFVSGGNRFVRPSSRPEIFSTHDETLAFLKERAGDQRVFLSRELLFTPGLTVKQGMLKGVKVAMDYEPLSVQRYATFFDYLAGGPLRRKAYLGPYALWPTSRWNWMNLLSTRYLALQRDEPADRFLRETEHSDGSTGLRLIRDGDVRIYENPDALPRAYVVPTARVLDGADAVISAFDDPDFDPRREVLLESPAAAVLGLQPGKDSAGSARIELDESERVVVHATTDTPALLVLADLFYPGWKAFVNDREVPIYRANYLFRAVRIEPGTSEVRFEFRPASVRHGRLVSAATALVLVAMTGWTLRGRRQNAPAPTR